MTQQLAEPADPVKPVSTEPPPPPAPSVASSGGRRPLLGQLPDRLFRYAVLGCGLSVIGIVVLIVYELFQGSRMAISQFGFHFFVGSSWDPVSGDFGALPFVYGTVVSSLLALALAVPLALGVAVFVTEI